MVAKSCTKRMVETSIMGCESHLSTYGKWEAMEIKKNGSGSDIWKLGNNGNSHGRKWKSMKIFGKTIIWKIMVILIKNCENQWEKMDNSLDMRKMIEHSGKFWYMAYGDGSGTYNWLIYFSYMSRELDNLGFRVKIAKSNCPLWMGRSELTGMWHLKRRGW